MKTLLLILTISFSPILTIAQKLTEIKILSTSTKKVVIKQSDNYLLLIDPNDFSKSLDKESSELTSLVVSGDDRVALKNYLKNHFNAQDTLNSDENVFPENIELAFRLLFSDYLNIELNKGNFSVYNISNKTYEKSAIQQIEEVIGGDNVFGIKLKDTVQKISIVTTYYTKDKQTKLYIFTSTKTQEK